MDRLYACIDTSDDTSIDNNYETHKKEKIKINSWINVGYFVRLYMWIRRRYKFHEIPINQWSLKETVETVEFWRRGSPGEQHLKCNHFFNRAMTISIVRWVEKTVCRIRCEIVDGLVVYPNIVGYDAKYSCHGHDHWISVDTLYIQQNHLLWKQLKAMTKPTETRGSHPICQRLVFTLCLK